MTETQLGPLKAAPTRADERGHFLFDAGVSVGARFSMPLILLGKAREKGLQESLELGRNIMHARLATRDRTERAYVFVSPPMNLSGAPRVLIHVIEEFADTYEAGSIRLLAPQIDDDLRKRITARGVRVERAAAVMGSALVRFQLALRSTDFVLLNTVAVPSNYLTYVLKALRVGQLVQANWYIHEDCALLPTLAPFLLKQDTRRVICSLVNSERLRVYVPSQRTKGQYDHLFCTEKTRILPPLLSNDGNMEYREADEYRSLRFLLSGRPTDGLKGHMLALAAFHEFLRTYHAQNPSNYRKFTLTFVGMTDDYVSSQIVSVGKSILGDSFRAIGEVTFDEAFKITRECNAVICCSFNETFNLSVAEGMTVGHVVLRNDSGGMTEQLDDGVNGLRIDSRDVRQFAGAIERVLNKTSTQDLVLQMMGRASQERVAGWRHAYVDALNDLRTPV